MKLTFKHTATLLAVLAATSSMSGCNFIGDSDPVFSEPGEVQLSGNATKYPLAGADVFACLVKSPCVTASSVTIQGSTGFVGQSITQEPDGSFDLRLTDAAAGKNITIRVIANSNTFIPDGQCDTADGACDQDFSTVELKTVTTAPVPTEGEIISLSDVQATVLSTMAAEILEADPEFTEDSTTEVVDAKAKAASKGVATLLGVDGDLDADTENFFKLKVPAATTTGLSSTTSTSVKNLAMVNASFSKLAGSGENLGTAIATVSTTIKNAVDNPSSIDTTTVTVIKNLATVVKDELAANSVTTGETAPTTTDPDTVTEESLEDIAEEIQEDIADPDGGGTGGTGGTGGSTGGSNG